MNAKLKWIVDYMNKQISAIQMIDMIEVDRIINTLYNEVLLKDKQLFVCGNGGSASNVSHFVTDLGKGASDKLQKRFRVLSLNENMSWITAIGNDYSYADIFVKQLQNYATKGDYLFVLGVSGSSPNVVKAVEWANENGVNTIGLVGKKGGKVKELVKECIVVQDEHYGRVEDAQMLICHLICYAFMELEFTKILVYEYTEKDFLPYQCNPLKKQLRMPKQNDV